MHISGLKQSNFLTKEDCGHGILVTIERLEQENVAKEGAPQELKYCLYFKEHEKPMVMNSTKGQMIAKITGSEETDTWPGHKIVLYHDPNISFGGKLVGGIACRAPRRFSKRRAKIPGCAVPPTRPGSTATMYGLPLWSTRIGRKARPGTSSMAKRRLTRSPSETKATGDTAPERPTSSSSVRQAASPGAITQSGASIAAGN